MRHKNELPPNYQKLLDFASWEIGLTFTDTQTNMKAISEHMGWRPNQVRAILGNGQALQCLFAFGSGILLMVAALVSRRKTANGP